MAMRDDEHPLLRKPLYIFSLPLEILSTITPKGDVSVSLNERSLSQVSKQNGETTATGTVGCATCNIPSFSDMEEQREHVRSDLHKFNLKRRVAGQPVVNSDDFDKMLDGMGISTHSDISRS
jgi:hypothetical protein